MNLPAVNSHLLFRNVESGASALAYRPPHWPVSHATAGRTRRTLMHAPCGATLRRSPPAYRSLRVLDCAGQPARLPPGFPNPRVGRLPPSSRAIRARSRATRSRHAVRSGATSPAAPRRLSSPSTIVHPRSVRAPKHAAQFDHRILTCTLPVVRCQVSLVGNWFRVRARFTSC